MVTFTSMKGSDDAVAALMLWRSVPNSGPPNFISYAGFTYSMATPSRVLGRVRETLFNRTLRYKPGSGLTNPIIHYDNSANCSSDSVPLHLVYELANGVRKPTIIRHIDGQIAAFAQTDYTSSYVTGRMPNANDLDILARALTKSRDTAADLAVTIGELPETLAMLAGPFRGLAKMGSKLRKFAQGPSRGLLSRLTNGWLLHQYGIVPLMNDVDTIREAINAKLGADRGPLLKKRARRVLDDGSESSSYSFSRNIGPCWLHGTSQIVSKTTVRATNYYFRQMSVLEDLGLGVSSLIPTAWELVPYSFVFDWFIDVGGWLKYALPNNSVQDQGNCMSVTTENTYTVQLQHASLTQTVNEYYPASPCSSCYEQRRKSYQRMVNLTLPVLPQVNRRTLNVSQHVSGAALALQRALNAFPRMR